jgi:hypothetical protein
MDGTVVWMVTVLIPRYEEQNAVTGTCAFALVTSAVTIGQKAAAAVVAGSAIGDVELGPSRRANTNQERMTDVDFLLGISIVRASREG